MGRDSPAVRRCLGEEAKGSIYLRGQLSVSMGLAGTAVHGLRLASGVGDYSVHVYASNRDVVTRRYTALFDGQRNLLSDEFRSRRSGRSKDSSGTWSSYGGNPEPALLRISRPSYALAVGSIAAALVWGSGRALLRLAGRCGRGGADRADLAARWTRWR